MNICRVLVDIALAVAKEAETNTHFRASIERALGMSEESLGSSVASKVDRRARKESSNSGGDKPPKSPRGGNRRAPATLDPVQLARESEARLRESLNSLSLDQLRDIIAEYGMDTGGLVAKWKTTERIMERIVEVAMQRAKKGDAFREQDDESATAHGPRGSVIDHEGQPRDEDAPPGALELARPAGKEKDEVNG